MKNYIHIYEFTYSRLSKIRPKVPKGVGNTELLQIEVQTAVATLQKNSAGELKMCIPY